MLLKLRHILKQLLILTPPLVYFIEWFKMLMFFPFATCLFLLFYILSLINLISISFLLLSYPFPGPGLQHVNILYFLLWAWVYIPINFIPLKLFIFSIATVSKSRSLITQCIFISLFILLVCFYFIRWLAFHRLHLISALNRKILTHKLFLFVQISIC